jgi:hypothetical protein
VAIPADINVTQKDAEKKTKNQSLGPMYIDTTNVEHEVCDHTGNNWSHRNSNKRFKEKFESHSTKTFKIVTTWNITNHTGSTAF